MPCAARFQPCIRDRRSVPSANPALAIVGLSLRQTREIQMVVTLIGYRGTGKTTVAPLLARRFGLDWIDADAEIERRAQRTIRRIFEEQGEPTFRTLESQLMAELLQREGLVIAAGGGAVLDPETGTRIRAAGPVVWLRAGIETILRQIAADPTTADRRPALTAIGGSKEIEALLAVREPLYRRCATITVNVDGLSADQIVEIISGQLHHGPRGSCAS
jgi:shikimate kinase